ncbi:lipo-releasing system ATP-binding protein LolD, partial [Vibrio parahaemolyticus V-223/04]|jgi:hypothetical protein
VLK